MSAASRKFQKFARLSNTFVQSSSEDGVPNIRSTSSNRLHSRCITSIKVSSGPDPFVVSAGLDCMLLISHFETGRIIKEIDTDQSFVFSISIKQNQSVNIIATASQDGNVRIYDCDMDYQCVRVIKQSSVGVCQILWTVVLFNDKNDTPFVLSAGATKSIHAVNWMTREEVLILNGHKEGVRCLDISAEGIIASGSNDRSVKLWNFSKKCFIQTLRGHKAEVNAVVFVPETTYLITACENCLFRQWDYGECPTLTTPHQFLSIHILTYLYIPPARLPPSASYLIILVFSCSHGGSSAKC